MLSSFSESPASASNNWQRGAQCSVAQRESRDGKSLSLAIPLESHGLKPLTGQRVKGCVCRGGWRSEKVVRVDRLRPGVARVSGGGSPVMGVN